jgi:hypothetical protein
MGSENEIVTLTTPASCGAGSSLSAAQAHQPPEDRSDDRRFGEKDLALMLGDAQAFPVAYDSIIRLHRSGWRLRVNLIMESDGRTVWEVSGRLGENRIDAKGATPSEAWDKATLAAAACGMLKGWPRPATGRA